MGEGNDEFGLVKYFCSYFPSDFLLALKSYDMGLPAILPLGRKAYCGFLSPLKIHHPRPGLNPRTFGPMASTLFITSRMERMTIVIIRNELHWNVYNKTVYILSFACRRCESLYTCHIEFVERDSFLSSPVSGIT
jgi:hypothetical protein